MRRPFIFFLLIVSLYCWLKELVYFFFYLFNIAPANKNFYSSMTGILGVLFCLYLVKITIYKGTNAQPLKDLFQTHRKKEWVLLLFVSMPVLVLGLYRSIYPDQNFDTFHFELYLQEYDFKENKINFSAGSLRSYYFPLANRIFGLFRHILGYRLGTFFNTFLLITIISSAYDFIKRFLSPIASVSGYRAILPGVLALFVVFADNTLFNTGSYKPDLIGVPLMLELLYLILFQDSPGNTLPSRIRLRHLYFFLLASLIITYKLTYVPHVGILCLIYFIKNFSSMKPVERIALPLFILLVPSFYLLYNQLETGNPIFPFFNTFFHSTLYPNSNFKDQRWGPQNMYETVFYPIVTWLNPMRCNEYALFSYRLLFGFLASWVAIVYYLLRSRKNKSGLLLRTLFFVSALALAFDYSCLLTTGYYRYAIIVETLYGLVLCLWLFYLRKNPVPAVLICMLISFQSCETFENIYYHNRNLSWHDYSILFHNKEVLHKNAALLLHDYGAVKDPANILPRVDGFVSMLPFPMDGTAKLLNKSAPIYDLYYSGRTADTVREFEKRVVRPLTENKLMVLITNAESFDETVDALNKRGYLATNRYELYPDFMKYGEPLFLLRIKYLDTAMYNITYAENIPGKGNPGWGRNRIQKIEKKP